MKDKLLRAIDMLGGKVMFSIVSGVVIIIFLLAGFTVDRTKPIKQPNKVTSTAPQRDGYDESTNNEYTIGTITFSVPSYWEERESDVFQYLSYSETGDSVACIEIMYLYDDEDPVTFDILKDETEKGLMSMAIKFEFNDCGDINYEEYDNGSVKGYIYELTKFKINDSINGNGLACVIPSPEDNSWIYIYLLQSENTEFRYENDFIKILDSIKQ
ncbi:MAG: hypothetical protein MJ153_08045 [Clostridia bacterium]|nr:hypothetical protein [Clostridia bacterium]